MSYGMLLISTGVVQHVLREKHTGLEYKKIEAYTSLLSVLLIKENLCLISTVVSNKKYCSK